MVILVRYGTGTVLAITVPVPVTPKKQKPYFYNTRQELGYIGTGTFYTDIRYVFIVSIFLV
jgi:hypothetical protein